MLMTPKEIRILMVEPEKNDAELIDLELRKSKLQFKTKRVFTKASLIEALEDFKPDIILCDYKMPSLSMQDVLKVAKKALPEAPIVIVSGSIGEESAVEALKLGASDYVQKDRLFRLVPVVERVLGEVEENIKLKKSGLDLAAFESNYRTIFEMAGDAMVVHDADNYNIVDANKKACETFCLPIEKVIGRDIRFMICGHDQHASEKIKQVCDEAATGAHKLYECMAKDMFNREFWIEINMKSAIVSGRYRILSVIRDITERRQITNVKENFMNMISHELRTPLGAIRETIALIAEGKLGSVSKEQKDVLSIGYRNVDRLSRLIEEVLDLQKLDIGKAEFELKENDINKVIGDVYKVMSPLADKKGLNFVLKLDDKLSNLKFDKDRIIQVLLNLINNAIKFTDKGSVVVTSTQGHGFAKISVKDTGIGISTKDLPNIFQRFVQIENKFGGSGLGLAISKEIVEKHNGKIVAESEEGKGSVFSFTLPI